MFRYGEAAAGDPGALATYNPADPAEQVGSYTVTPSENLPALVRDARSAQRVWAARPVAARCDDLRRWLDVVEARQDDIARAITLEQGKPLAEARGECVKALQEARIMLGIAMQPLGAVHAGMRPGVLPLTTRRPRGLIVAITPWNFPVLTPMRKIAPALAFGNAILLKPSELAPAAACLLAEAAVGILPPGLLQIVLGDGALGAALVTSGAEGITFTGSVGTGKAIYRAAADTLAELSLELGGKNAALVHEARNLDACLDQIAGAAFLCSGQRCTAISRVIVRRELAEAVTTGLVQRAEALRVGDGREPGVTFGPLVSGTQRDRVAEMVAQGIHSGARCRTGGRALDRTGNFYAPTILDQVSRANPVAREEIFGPVIAVLAYDQLDEAFEILNETEFGLSAALFATSQDVIDRFIRQGGAGMLHVNHGTTPDSNMPFVGIANSGVGACSVGPGAAAFYTTEHAVYLGQQPEGP